MSFHQFFDNADNWPVTTQPLSMLRSRRPQYRNLESDQYFTNAIGLETLSQLGYLFIEQKVDLLEAFTGWEEANQYAIFDPFSGTPVYQAFEESGICARQCFKSRRGFIIHVIDVNNHAEVLRISRLFSCCAHGGCWPCSCCHYEVIVESPLTGEVLGAIRSQPIFCGQRFAIFDSSGTHQLSIEGSCCLFSFWPHDFDVYNTTSGTVVGKVSKKWSGIVKETFTNADNFGLSFNLEMDVKLKACLIGATFLIDFMYFEEQTSERTQASQ